MAFIDFYGNHTVALRNGDKTILFINGESLMIENKEMNDRYDIDKMWSDIYNNNYSFILWIKRDNICIP